MDGKSSQEYLVNTDIPQGSILSLTLFPLYIDDLLCDVIYNTGIYVDYTTLYSKYDLSFFWDCSLSLEFCQTALYGMLLSCPCLGSQ